MTGDPKRMGVVEDRLEAGRRRRAADRAAKRPPSSQPAPDPVPAASAETAAPVGAPRPDDERWVSIDSRSLLPASDQALRSRVESAQDELGRLLLRFGPQVHAMRSAMAGQPQAASTDHDGVQVPWCWEHERTVIECMEDDRLCTGELLTGPSDPTGSAAVTPDRAARDHHDFVKRLELAVRSISEAGGIAARYPTSHVELPDVEADPGDTWCRSCHKDDKYCEPITMKPGTTTPYYAGLCRWCGRKRADLGEGMDPPTWLVQMHHRRQQINAGHMDKARAQLAKIAVIRASTKKPKGKPKGKGRRR